MKILLNKLKNFVQKAMDTEGTTAIFQIGNSETANREILKVKSLIEKTGGEVEWYYFDNTISTEELLFELTVMKPHVNKIFGFCEDNAVFYVKGEKNGIK